MAARNTTWRTITAITSVMGLMALAAPSSASPKDDRSFLSSFDCREVALGVTIDTAAVQAYVPDAFVIHEVAGKTELAVFTQDCEIKVESGSWNPSVMSGVFVFVSERQGSGELQAFDLHWGTNDPAYFNALRNLGVGDFTRGSTYSSSMETPGVLEITSSVNWKPSPFEISATTVTATSERAPFESVHWLSGSHGLVRGTFPHQITARPAEGTLTLTQGTLLHDIVGETEVSTGGVYFEFTIENGVTETVP